MTSSVGQNRRARRTATVSIASHLPQREESARLDTELLEGLVRQLGADAAERMVGQTMETLALQMAELDPLYRCARTAELARRAQALAQLADGIGLRSYATVARHVEACALRDDWPALAAVLARLERVADRSLMALWDLQDLRL